MPVTKKKGAIFPIYADTPPRPGPAPKAPSPAEDEARPPSASGRPALANIEPAPVRRRSSPRKRSGLGLGGGLALASSSSLGRAAGRAPRSPTRAKMDVFADPEGDKPAKTLARPLSSKSLGKTTKPLAEKPSLPSLSKPLSAKPLASNPQALSSSTSTKLASKASKPLASKPTRPLASSASSSALGAKPRAAPPKRARSPSGGVDKENAAPDSPAARTRSKLRIPDAPSGPAVSGAEKPSAKSTKTSTKTKTKPRAFTVFVDPLADVSEAYGASGGEPAGFREQGSRSRRTIRS